MSSFTRFFTIALLVFSAVSAFAGVPRLELMMLTQPDVMAVGFYLPETRLLNFGQRIGNTDVRRYDFRIGGDIVYPMQYHPQAHANATAGFGLNWGMTFPIPEKMFQGTYIGSIFLTGGVEGLMDSSKKYHARNYTYSTGIEHQIPFTDFMRVVNSSAEPAQLRTAVTLVHDQLLDSSHVRADAELAWSIPMALGTAWITSGEGHWAKDIQPYAYLTSGASYRMPVQTGGLPIGIEPVAFIRFVTGCRPPTYEILNHWEYGVTASLTFPGMKR